MRKYLLEGGPLAAVAAPVEQDPVEGNDRIALNRIGIAANQAGARVVGGRGGPLGFQVEGHQLTAGIGEGGGLQGRLAMGRLHIADRAAQLAELSRHALIALGADTGGPVDTFAHSYRGLPLGTNRRQVGGEIGAGA
jgi:hypothetical protein